MATKYLTPEQFVKLPLSEAIPYVIADMKKMVKSGIKLNMSLWFDTNYETDEICSVCAGGAACLGFYPMSQVHGATPRQLEQMLKGSLGPERIALRKLQYVFNEIRTASYEEAVQRWYRKVPRSLKVQLEDLREQHTPFCGEVTAGRETLYKQMRELARLLKKNGR